MQYAFYIHKHYFWSKTVCAIILQKRIIKRTIHYHYNLLQRTTFRIRVVNTIDVMPLARKDDLLAKFVVVESLSVVAICLVV